VTRTHFIQKTGPSHRMSIDVKNLLKGVAFGAAIGGVSTLVYSQLNKQDEVSLSCCDIIREHNAELFFGLTELNTLLGSEDQRHAWSDLVCLVSKLIILDEKFESLPKNRNYPHQAIMYKTEAMNVLKYLKIQFPSSEHEQFFSPLRETIDACVHNVRLKTGVMYE